MASTASSAAKAPGQVHCDVCNVYVSSVGLLETHTKGKKHQQMVKLREEQERASKVSVYVTGFNCSDTSEDEMSGFFTEYGPVKKIYFDKNKGRFAIIEFENENSATAILEKTDPVIFKGKTLKIKKRTFISHSKSDLEHSEIKDVTGVAKKRKKKHSETLSCILSNAIIDKMNQASSVSEQIETLINELSLSKEDLHLRSLICDMLKEVFKEFVPTCEVVLFGSSANGLGCKGSDLDITLLVDPNIEHWNIDLDELTAANKNTDQKASSASKDIHSFVVKVLRNVVPGCANVIPIFTAKCPVIKFIHQTTSISCDLTVNNRLGLHNTDLLKCYMELDPRVSPLVHTVRTWAKAIGISRGGSGQLTNYALTIMVLNFLQTTVPPVLPSLQDVSGWPTKDSCKTSMEKELVDGWDCSFYKDVGNLPPSTNSKSVETLLEEFFDFYASKFDYANCAVTIRKHDHFLISSLEEELQRPWACNPIDENENAEKKKEETTKTKESVATWKTTPLCVQDPFELTHNLTQNVGVSALRDIIQYMIDARNICQRFSSDGQLNMSSTDRGIVQLFKYTLRTVSKKQKKDGYSFTVHLNQKQDSASTSAVVLSSFVSVDSFFQSLCQHLEDELKMKCMINSEKQSEGSLSAVFTANINTWTHCRRERRKALHHDEPSTSVDKDTNAHEDDSSVTQQNVSDKGKDVESPCLVFGLTVNKDPLPVLKGQALECNVKLEHLGGQGLQTFENFYAYFKKQIAVVFK